MSDCARTEHGGVTLHDLLHLEANLRRRSSTVRVAQPIEARDAVQPGVARQGSVPVARFEGRGNMLRRRTPEHDEVEQ